MEIQSEGTPLQNKFCSGNMQPVKIMAEVKYYNPYPMHKNGIFVRLKCSLLESARSIPDNLVSGAGCKQSIILIYFFKNAWPNDIIPMGSLGFCINNLTQLQCRREGVLHVQRLYPSEEALVHVWVDIKHPAVPFQQKYPGHDSSLSHNDIFNVVSCCLWDFSMHICLHKNHSASKQFVVCVTLGGVSGRCEDGAPWMYFLCPAARLCYRGTQGRFPLWVTLRQ